MPRLDGVRSGPVADEDGIEEVAEKLFGEFGLGVLGGDEVGERAEHAVTKASALGQQGGSRRGEPDAVAFECLKRRASGGEFGKIFLDHPPFGQLAGLAIAGLAEPEAGLFGGARAVPCRIAFPLGGGAGVGEVLAGQLPLLDQLGAVGFLLGDPFTQRRQFALERRALAFERPELLGCLLQRVFEGAHGVALGGEARPHRLFLGSAASQLGLNPVLLDRGALMLGRGTDRFPARLLQADFEIAPLRGGALAALGRVGQPLGGDGEVALEALQFDARRREIFRHRRPMALGSVARVGRRLPRSLDRGEARARRRQDLGQCRVPALERLGIFGQLIQPAASERDGDREALFGERGVSFGLSLLACQRTDLRLDLGDEVLEPLQVAGGFLETARRGVASIAIHPDARGFLEQRAAFLGAVRQEQVDHLGFDDHAGITAEAGAAQQVLDVTQTDGRLVQQVVALARAGKPPSHHDFGVRRGQVAGGVVEVERDFGDVHGAAGGGALEDHVLHLAAAEQPRGLLAQDPADRVRDVRLAAAVGPDNRGDAVLEGERDGVGKRLEAGQFEPGELHRITGMGLTHAAPPCPVWGGGPDGAKIVVTGPNRRGSSVSAGPAGTMK